MRGRKEQPQQNRGMCGGFLVSSRRGRYKSTAILAGPQARRGSQTSARRCTNTSDRSTIHIIERGVSKPPPIEELRTREKKESTHIRINLVRPLKGGPLPRVSDDVEQHNNGESKVRPEKCSRDIARVGRRAANGRNGALKRRESNPPRSPRRQTWRGRGVPRSSGP